MHNKARLSVTLLLALGTSAAIWRYVAFPASSPGQSPPVQLQEIAAERPDTPDRDDLRALLSDPRVEKYLQREEDKGALEAYFNGDGGDHTDEEIWQLIEAIEGEGRVMAYEGLALKLAWLERNSASKAEFDAAARELMEKYRREAESSAREYDPYEDVPGFAEYKQAEQRIIERVKAMDSFPDGASRQEYLRQQLQAAREKAYSNSGN